MTSTVGKTRLAMKGNTNAVKDTTKTEWFQIRMTYEDKLQITNYCDKHGFTQSDFLTLAMVELGILPVERTPVKKD